MNESTKNQNMKHKKWEEKKRNAKGEWNEMWIEKE